MKRSVTDTELVETKTPPWNRETLASVDRRTLAAEVERMEAECRYKHECMRQFMEEASLANKRAEAAEARVAEMEKKLMRQEEVAREAYEAAAWKYGQERMELEAQNARLRAVLEGEYQRVAPVIVDYPVQPWEHLGEGRMLGTWAEDGSPYHFAIPFQLVPAFQAMQRLASLTKRPALADGKAAPTNSTENKP